ncbi:double-strand break repair protein AddB [Aureimonas populi]|uniref:Double-strand break repair protein AddB n=1 Tax=Aureimonas populi TaxID=1701758 RepID=A0ABW5CQ42_9HYPH|nr:double-strand break repair protein AddB [Aureimonas populi]
MPANIFSIAPGLPFLPTLARSILSGRIVKGVMGSGDPLALADLTVYVPTRRAAIALTAAFAHEIGGPAAILPRVRPLGQDEDDAPFFGAPALLPAVDPLRRRLELARLVRFWKSRIGDGTASMLAGEDIVLPASAADALYLASDLATLLDEAEDEEISLSGLARLGIEDRLAEWWQLTLTFLAILTEEWPRHLAEIGMVSSTEIRRRFARETAARYRAEGSPGPVVIAGSTATAPATIELMRAVAELQNGAVVLPGLDRTLDAPSFAGIERAASLSAAGHPQYGLKRILGGLGVPREAVATLAPDAGSAPAAREAFVSDALRPAETTELWAEGPAHPPAALDDLALIEAADEREEALAIAVAMRDALSDPAATVALTTPDRDLARRVAAELARFGIDANDSAGRPLSATPPGTLATLALAASFEPGDPVALVSLLKHPLTRLGLSQGAARRAARVVELIALRGGSGRADAATLPALFARRRAAIEGGERVTRPVQHLGPEERDEGQALCERLAGALSPLVALRRTAPAEVATYAVALTQAMEALGADEDGSTAGLYAEEAGAAFAALMRELVAAPPVGFAFAPAEWPDVFRALAAETTARPRAGHSQRAFVWGALEARLQSVDTMILGGLNEGTWPQGARSDAFLSRLMRSEILLDPPERRIGLAAHDFWMAMGHPRVVLARSARAGGAPAIPSRWLQRLLTLAGPEGEARLRAAGEPFLAHARALDAAPPEPRAARPEPRPPVEARPRAYSITEVERLIRDPYAIHAKRVLNLDRLPPPIRAPGAAERGNLFHAILARMVERGVDPAAPDAEARLLAIAREAFDEEALPADIRAIWWPRMEGLAGRILAWERGRAVAKRHAELGGFVELADIGVALKGYADRIDAMEDGSVEIIDFKTGTQPSVKQARTLLAPQLPLEAAMARLGAFKAVGPVETVSELLYVRLRERAFKPEGLSHSGGASGEAVTADGLGEEALARFKGLAASYLDPAKGFLSRARPLLSSDFSGDYDHLSRAREWALGDEDDAQGDGA